MRFQLNGKEQTAGGDPERSLLRFLREDLDLVSVKDGCSPQAACGSCTVLVNGKAALACVVPMKSLQGARVVTIEGLDPALQATFANAFAEKGGVQCGFCIPGMVLRAKALLDRIPAPSRAEVAGALSPNLCRCTGYKKILDSVLYAAAAIREGRPITPPRSDGRVGQPHPKYGAADLTLGRRRYVADMKLPAMLHAALKFSEHPRAEVLEIDTAAARALAGVVRVFTAEDVVGERFIGLIKSDWPLMVAEGETTRCVGDVLAGVVAETVDIARQAATLIEVRYRPLPPLVDPHQAMRPESPALHPGGNVLSRSVVKRADADRALAESAHRSRGVYQTQAIEHGFLEPEAAIALPKEGGAAGVKVFSQGQGVYEDRRQIARLLALPEEAVQVVLVPNGGAFGGKEDLSVQGHAALFAHRLGVPVKLELTRAESIAMHPKRHPLWMEYELGCDSRGRLTALKARIVGDTGAYASVGMKVLERAAGHATGAYHVPAVDVVATAVYTNNLPNGAMRGFGVNQVTFAVEGCIDDLCAQGGFDRWKFRYDNAIDSGRMTATGQVISAGAGVRATLKAVEAEFRRARYAGLACGIKNTGIGNGMPDTGRVKIFVEGPERVVVQHGWTEMGQGVDTVAVQTLCQETGLDPAIVVVEVDTGAEAYSGMTTASRATSLIGNALIDACRGLKADLAGRPLAELTGRVYPGEWTVDWTTKPGAEGDSPVHTHYSYSYATQLVTLDADGRVAKITAAHDAGKIFNPLLFEGQIEGSIHMGLGYALSEDFPQRDGRPESTRYRKMGILRSRDMPRIEIVGVEVPDPYGPYGAKGVGEIGLVPTAAAVANAFCEFDGVRRFRLPIKPKKKWRGKESSSPAARGGPNS